MARINVYDYGDPPMANIEGEFVGWFSPEAAERFREATWRGTDVNVSVNPVGRYESQTLFRTRGGRWVLATYSAFIGVDDLYKFIPPDQARKWLVLNEHGEAAERLLGAPWQ